MAIKNDTFVGAVSSPSPNFGKIIKPVFIVMHYTAGWSVEGTLDRFADPSSKVSAQLTIDVDGTVYQHVPFNRAAWHAGPSAFGGYSGLNSHSVGIEFVNPGFLRLTASEDYLDAYGSTHEPSEVGNVLKAKCPRAGSGDFYWKLYTPEQLNAADAVVKDLIATYGILDIVTHEEIDTRGWKTDPGPAFPMNRYRALLRDRKNSVVHYEVTASTLNARSGPGAAYKVNRELAKGTRVEELARVGGWVRIDSDDWVNGAYLRLVA
jgi:N-acetylmuramoyl-L-alanine amidase